MVVVVVICLERGADCLHMVQLMPFAIPKPHHLLPHLNPDWLYLSGTRLSWKRGRETGVVGKEGREGRREKGK